MPFVRANLRAPDANAPILARIARAAGVLFIAGFAIFALALLAVRFVVFPRVEEYRGTLTTALSRELGQPVEIDSLATGWDGWNPKLVIGGFRVRGATQGSDAAMLDLPQVELIVAWTSLPLFELRLKELVIERPQLAVRRDASGTLHIAGLRFDPNESAGDAPVTDWVLRQHRIIVRDALITWDDEARNAPQLVLEHVMFKLENRFGRHRFGLKGVPPTELSAPIDLRGDFRLVTKNEWRTADGTLYIRLDYADVGAWRQWVQLPVQLTSGKGALRLWFEVSHGEARSIVADLELEDVRARLGETLPPLDLAHLSGRVSAKSSPTLREISTRDLAFVTATGLRLDPTNFTLTMNEPESPKQSGQIEFDQIQLEPLSDLAIHTPLPERWRAELARFAARGTLMHGRLTWQGDPDAPTAFSGSTEFGAVGFRAQDGLPGITGVSGSLTATRAGGELTLTTRKAALELPQIFAAPVAFERIAGNVQWERKGDRTAVRFDKVEFALPGVTGTAAGTYRSAPKGTGELEMTAQLSNVDLREASRDLPLFVNNATRDWLRQSLVAGIASDARVKLTGQLSDFPFADGKSGQFLITSKLRGVTLAYAERWPPLEALDAEIRLEGTRLTIDAVRGHTFDLKLGRTHAEIPDLRLAVPLLRVEGDATGPVGDVLRFVSTSPVAEMIGRVTEGVEGTGGAHLTSKLEFSLGKPDVTRIAGELTLADAQFRLAGMPSLTKVNGKLAFTEKEVRARDVTMDVAGGPARLTIANADGHPHISGSGIANLAAIRALYPSELFDRVNGTVDWTLGGDLRRDGSTWQFESNMKGASIDLPAPLGKQAGEVIPLRLARRGDAARPNEDDIEIAYGRVMELSLNRERIGESMATQRALLSLGRAVESPGIAHADRPGLWVRADLASLNVDDWLALRAKMKPEERVSSGDLVFSGFDLDAGILEVFGRRYHDMKVGARRAADEWKLEVRAREGAGTAQWFMPDDVHPNGRLVARLSRFAMPGAAELPPWGGVGKAGTITAPGESTNAWPAMDIAADTFISHDRDLGRVEVIAQPSDKEWQIEKLVLANDSGRIDAKGAWRVTGRAQQTRLDVALETKDAGAFLTRFGYPDAVKGASTKISGQLAWSGAPSEFDYPTLSGALKIAVGPGRFTKIEPGIGKLLGVLSLQALPRRITLDFQDIFSDGFAFDEVTGNVRVKDGVMSTDDLRLVGPAAKVDIAGDADLAHETQRLGVKVQPALSTSVSAGAALLFLANPIVGAAVGAGALLAQKVLKDPIEQMFSYQYAVTGSWSEPIVTRGATATASMTALPGVPVESATK
jgi:uncharacterized protein (TIGR02099 family)